jgi:hypothetical protein
MSVRHLDELSTEQTQSVVPVLLPGGTQAIQARGGAGPAIGFHWDQNAYLEFSTLDAASLQGGRQGLAPQVQPLPWRFGKPQAQI